ncbi:Ig-like domain-containing protein [Thermus scotoductus]|uniref:Ig-like domain-containing protein n=1 Tax=Thermus scotoductus TaxID=37636 RepID=UPI00345556F4
MAWRNPPAGAQVSGVETLEVEASDNVGVAKVEFYAGATKLGEDDTAPYQWNWDTTRYPEGPITLRARALDGAGNVSEAQLEVTVANADKSPPTVAWRNPPAGAQVSGVETLEVEASDNVGVAKVEFYAGATKLGEDDTAPYQWNWDTTRYPEGPITLRARALDGAGNVSEAQLEVTVANAIFRITTPADGEQVGPGAGREIVTVTIGLNGTVPAGVRVNRVEVYINGLLAGTASSQNAGDGSQIFVYAWDTRSQVGGHDPTASGDRVITAKVSYTNAEGETVDTFTDGVRVTYRP